MRYAARWPSRRTRAPLPRRRACLRHRRRSAPSDPARCRALPSGHRTHSRSRHGSAERRRCGPARPVGRGRHGWRGTPLSLGFGRVDPGVGGRVHDQRRCVRANHRFDAVRPIKVERGPSHPHSGPARLCARHGRARGRVGPRHPLSGSGPRASDAKPLGQSAKRGRARPCRTASPPPGDGPRNVEFGVIPEHAALGRAVIGRGHLVDDLRIRLERAETVQETPGIQSCGQFSATARHRHAGRSLASRAGHRLRRPRSAPRTTRTACPAGWGRSADAGRE